MSEETQPTEPTGDEGKEQPKPTENFTQADVDRIVADRLKRERETTKAKYADYDDLKKQAEGKKSVEDRLAEMEAKATAAEVRAMRSDIAARNGISAEDRDLFLTGTDEETLAAQAKRLVERDDAAKKGGNRVPNASKTPSNDQADEDRRAFVRQLTGRA